MKKETFYRYIKDYMLIRLNISTPGIFNYQRIKITGLKPECRYVVSCNGYTVDYARGGRIDILKNIPTEERICIESSCRCKMNNCHIKVTIYY
jgi:hypothetical protein